MNHNSPELVKGNEHKDSAAGTLRHLLRSKLSMWITRMNVNMPLPTPVEECKALFLKEMETIASQIATGDLTTDEYLTGASLETAIAQVKETDFSDKKQLSELYDSLTILVPNKHY